MNQLLSRRLGGFLLAASLLSSCQQDPSSPTSSGTPFAFKNSAGGGTSTAHPAITYAATTVSHNVTYATIGVMDTDAGHQTNVVTAGSSNSTENLMSPSWNYSGASITYKDIAGTASSIKAVDVSVNSSGVPVGSNVRTIYALTTSDSATIQSGPAWCATSSTGKIAFTRNHLGSQLGLSELCTVSQSGGTVTVLASYSKLNTNHIVMSHYTSPTWSPDDAKIAVIREDTIQHSTVMIYDASSGAALDSIPLAGGVTSLEWSRSGMNELVYLYTPNSSTPYELYYVAPTTGSTPTTNSVVAGSPTWSPNNSGIMFVNSGLKKVVPFTSSITTISSSAGGNSLNWKR